MQIHFIQNIQHGRKLQAVGTAVVHMTVNSDKSHIFLFEIDFGIKTRLQVIAPDAAHVFDQYRSDFPAVNIRHHLLPARTFKVSSAESVVRIMPAVFKAVCGGIGFKILLLPKNRKGLSFVSVLAGYTLIQRCHFHGLHPPSPVRLSISFSPCSGRLFPDFSRAAVSAFLPLPFLLPSARPAAPGNCR